MPKIVTVAARKGGVGKTTIAYELAWLLGAPLVDLEFDDGSATRMWGYRHEARLRAPLLDAIERGTVPRPLTGYHKPELVPCHPDFQLNQPEPDIMADTLTTWAQTWDHDYVVVDTHGGGSPSGDGAIAAASLVIVPTPLKTKDLNATEGMVNEMPDYPLVLVPSMVPRVPGAAEIRRIGSIVDGTPITVAEPIPYVRGSRPERRGSRSRPRTPPPKRTPSSSQQCTASRPTSRHTTLAETPNGLASMTQARERRARRVMPPPRHPAPPTGTLNRLNLNLIGPQR